MKKAAECFGHSTAFLFITYAGKIVSDQLLDCCAHIFHIGGWLEAGNDISLAVNEKFGEIPLHVSVFLKILIHLFGDAVHSKTHGTYAEPSNVLFSDSHLYRGMAFSPSTSILENWGNVMPKRPVQKE